MSVTLPTWSIDEDIYTGFWINPSLGTFRGATLTLSRQTGGLIIAFVALYVGATGRSLWKIIRFLMHAVYTTPIFQDGVYHQRQAILRNTPMAYNAAIDLLWASFVWRDRAKGARRRLLPVALVAAILSIVSIAAGIFSSKALINTRSEVLISGQNCGLILSDLNPNISIESRVFYQQQKVADYFSYATKCYHNTKVQGTESCNKFTISTLPYTSNKNASCPFAEEMCKSNTGNLLLDSGYLDSLDHLGLIKGPRFAIRYYTHCAPLNTQNFTEVITASNSSQRFLRYKYWTNNTESFVYQLDKEKPSLEVNDLNQDYKISPFAFSDKNNLILPQFNQPNTTVSLIFLDASEIIYFNETNDPWFSATTGMGNIHDPMFLADTPVSVLGCATKRFYCNPSLPDNIGCIDGLVPISPGKSYPNALTAAWPAAKDQAVLSAVLAALDSSGLGFLDNFYHFRGLPFFLSRNTLVGPFQAALLPSDMWQAEREHLYKASLVAIQSKIVEFARGSRLGDKMYCEADKPFCQRNCYSQKVRSLKYYSFSVWVLAFILGIGGIIMLLSILIEHIFALQHQIVFLRESRRFAYGAAEWQAGTTLQLQRLAHEALGLGRWSRADETVPVTEAGETLGVLDVSNAKHARLSQPSVEMNRLITREEGAVAENRARYLRTPTIE